MKQYVDLVTRILEEGGASDDRTGTGTVKIFGHQSTYNMDDGFPLLTLKNTWMKGVTHELLWLLGNHTKLDEYKDLPMTNIKYMVDNKVHIWDEWADENGNLGPVYGKQWVDWQPYHNMKWLDGGNINQIQNIVEKLTAPTEDKPNKNFNPMDRGLIVSAWNVGELDEMALRPCHAFFQFQARELSLEERTKLYKYNENIPLNPLATFEELYDSNDVPKYELSLQLYQRSADTFLGVPFNIASYSLLLHMVCHVTGMKPGKFVHTFGDAHLYNNHREQVNKFLHRTKENYEGMINMLIDEGKEPTFKKVEDKVDEMGGIKDYWSNIGFYKGLSNYGPELPTLKLNPDVKNIFDFTYDDIEIVGYKPYPTISAPVSV